MSFLAVIEALTPLSAILIAVKTRLKQRQQQQPPPCTCRCACDEDVNVCWVLTEMDRTRRCWLKNPAILLLLLLLPSLGWDGVTRDGQFRRRSSLHCRAWKKALTDLKSVGAHNDDKQFEHHIGRDMIRYDTRCFFDVQSTADMSQFNLPRGTNN